MDFFLKDLFFYFTVPPTLQKWLEKKLRTKKSSDRVLSCSVEYINICRKGGLLRCTWSLRVFQGCKDSYF